MEQNSKQFPAGFLWGAATSSYQIEGGLRNDWSEWERSKKRVTALERRGLNPADFQSGISADSWNRFEEDIACLQKINASAYRFSIEWARVEPEEGRFDQAALNHYAKMIARLREEGIEPFVTVWHWPVPLWMHAKGGWASSLIVDYFKKYTERLVEAFPTVKFWITLNEPDIFAGKSYLAGQWPPQKYNPFVYLRVVKHLIKAHRAAFSIIKQVSPQAQVGIASQQVYFESAGGPINRFLKYIADWRWNFYFFNKIADCQDFIGLNFYRRKYVNYGFFEKKEFPHSDMGWELCPKGIYFALKGLARYGLPIYITENGLADAADAHRARYIEEVLRHVLKAINEGVPVRAYLHWSLIDNFEWAEGHTKKFGLFEIVPGTLERKARPSVESFARIAKNNSL